MEHILCVTKRRSRRKASNAADFAHIFVINDIDAEFDNLDVGLVSCYI